MNNIKTVVDEELDINDYIDVLVNRNNVIVIVFLIIIVPGLIINFLRPTKTYYKSESIIEIPRVEYLPRDGKKIKIKEIMTSNQAIIIFRSKSFLRELLKDSELSIPENEMIDMLQNNVSLGKLYNTEYSLLEIVSTDKTKAFDLAKEIIKKYEPIANRALKQYIVEFQMKNKYITNFRIIDPPQLPKNIYKVIPNKKKKIIFLVFTALFFSVIAPFIVEFFEHRKIRRSSGTAKTVN